MAARAVLVAVLLACRACGGGGDASIHHQVANLKEEIHHLRHVEAKEEAKEEAMEKAAQKQISRLKKTVHILENRTDQLEEQRHGKKRDLRQEGLLRVPEKFDWVFMIIVSGVTFLPVAVLLNCEHLAVGLKEKPLAAEYTPMSGAEDELVLEKQDEAVNPDKQQSLCSRAAWFLLRSGVALSFGVVNHASYKGLCGSSPARAFCSGHSLDRYMRGAQIWSTALAGAAGWSFIAAASSASVPQAGGGETATDARWPCMVLTILRLAGTERRGGSACWVAWTVVNSIVAGIVINVFLMYAIGVTDGKPAQSRMMYYELTCDAAILAYHWTFACILRGHCSPPPTDVVWETSVSIGACMLAAFLGPLVIHVATGHWSSTVVLAVMNAMLTASSLACILLLECELLPLTASVDAMIAPSDGTVVSRECGVDEVKRLQDRVKTLQTRWQPCLCAHCILGGLALVFGSLALFFTTREKGHLDSKDKVFCMFDLNFSILFSTFLFLQILCIARYNTKVHDFYMAVDNPDIALMVTRGELSFKIFGKTLDMPYFRTLASTSAASLAVGALRSHLA